MALDVHLRCIMWIILVLLWLLPLLLLIVLAARALGGSPVINDDEWRFVFRDTKQMKLSVWMLFSFAVLGVVFFVLGFLEATVLINMGILWMVIVPLITGLVAMLLVALWLRTGARAKPVSQGSAVRRRAVERRFSNLLSR
jgi:hypothetical protein